MKRVLITLALLALAGAAFAANINDTSVTAENWTPSDQNFTASDLADDNGFTAYTDTEGYVMASIYFMGGASGWLFDPNETINVSVSENFITDEWLETDGTEECSILFVVANSDTHGAAQYIAPYTGPGDYTLEYFGAAGLNPGDEIDTVLFMMGELDMDEGGTHLLSAPAGSTLTVRFNSSERPETAVPEPTAIAYGLVGLAPLFGLKKRIRK